MQTLMQKGALSTQVSTVLTEAFLTNPVMLWISPNPKFIAQIYRDITPGFLPHRNTLLTDCNRGAALWLPPGAELSGALTVKILLTILFKFGWRAFRRAITVFSAFEKHRIKAPHYYLYAIGAQTAARGQGLGSALLNEVLDRCDREGVMAYLENTNRANLNLYLRHGFEIIGSTQFDDGVPVWFMQRKPRESGVCVVPN